MRHRGHKAHTKLVIFDLDGTLVDAYPAITQSFNYVMHSFGYPVQKASLIRKAVGWGDEQLLKNFVKEKDLPRVLKAYRRHHAESLLTGSRLLPGVRRVLEYLKRRGYTLAVASNRPTRFSRILMKHLGLVSYMRYLLCADTLPRGKPDPLILKRIMRRFSVSTAETRYVGDMTIDALTGKRAGVKTVIVTTGSSSLGDIRREKPYRIIHRIAELMEVL